MGRVLKIVERASRPFPGSRTGVPPVDFFQINPTGGTPVPLSAGATDATARFTGLPIDFYRLTPGGMEYSMADDEHGSNDE